MDYVCQHCEATFKSESALLEHYESHSTCRDGVWDAIGKPKVERAKREILADVAAGTVPATVASYKELHDFVDANYYGGAFDAETGKTPETYVVDTTNVWFWNRLQDAVHHWIREGGIGQTVRV